MGVYKNKKKIKIRFGMVCMFSMKVAVIIQGEGDILTIFRNILSIRNGGNYEF